MTSDSNEEESPEEEIIIDSPSSSQLPSTAPPSGTSGGGGSGSSSSPSVPPGPIELESFIFTNLSNVTRDEFISSNLITLNAFTVSPFLGLELISNTSQAQFRVNGGNWTHNTTNVSGGDTLELRLLSSSLFNTTENITIQVGDYVTSWSIRTKKEIAGLSCYDSNNVGEIGTGSPCENMLIVNNTLLRGATSSFAGGDSSFEILGPDSNVYTFGNSTFNIFTGQVTNMSDLFRSTTFNDNIGYWDVSSVTDMTNMFFGASSFDSDLSSWDVSSVTNMGSMFSSASSFNQDLRCWNVSLIEGEPSFFASSSPLNTNGMKPVWGTNGGDCLSPNPFIFVNQSDVALDTLTQSNTITLTGFSGSLLISISGNGSPEFSINSGSWTNSLTSVVEGDTLQLRLTSSSNFEEEFVVIITLGDFTTSWSVVTEEESIVAILSPFNECTLRDNKSGCESFYVLTVVDGIDVVHDTILGLYWEQSPSTSTMNWPNAQTHCSSIGSGWRLPTLVEMHLSLVDMGRSSAPYIVGGSGGGNLFESIQSNRYWTYTRRSMFDVFILNFNSGLSDYFGPLSITPRVLCVREAPDFDEIWGVTQNFSYLEGKGQERVSGEFEIDDSMCGGATTIYDTITNLCWERNPSTSPFTHAQAISHCNSVTTAGGDWRLPQKAELMTLLFHNGDSQTASRLNSVGFSSILDNIYWSNTITNWDSSRAFNVDFDVGYLRSIGVTSSRRALCVKDPSIQESEITSPNPFLFTNETGVVLDIFIESNIVTITNFTSPLQIEILDNSSEAQFRINGGSWLTTSSTINEDDTLQLRLLSSSLFNTSENITIQVVDYVTSWSIQTEEELIIVGLSCYDPLNVGLIGGGAPCQDMLIVNNSMLRSVGSSWTGGDESFAIDGSDSNTYTYGDSSYNIFTGQVTNMFFLFGGSTFNDDINYWDVSNVTNMSGLFWAANSFNQPLNDWNVSSVIDMNRMFQEVFTFNQSLNNWDVSSVIDMSYMFHFAESFNQPLNDWNVSNVINMRIMFQDAYSFNQSLNNWDVSNVEDMSYMFNDASSFNQDLRCWNVSLIGGEPFNFASLSPLNTNGMKPVWGSDGSACSSPNLFSFTNETDVGLDTFIESNIVTLSNFTFPLQVQILDNTSEAQFRINGGSWTFTSSTINEDDTLQLRLLSSSSFNTTENVTIQVGDYVTSWSIQTEEEVIIPTISPFFNTCTLRDNKSGCEIHYVPDIVDGIDVIHDTILGLYWEQSPTISTFTWQDARDSCSNLGDGWRLPTLVERKLSLVDIGRSSSPYIIGGSGEGNLFNNIQNDNFDSYWTNTRRSSSQALYARFSVADSGSDDVTFSYHVLCVKEAPDFDETWGVTQTFSFEGGLGQERVSGEFEVDASICGGAGTMYDTITNFCWERSPSTNFFNNAQAISRCDSLSTAGGEWRLPERSELMTLLFHNGDFQTASRLNSIGFSDIQNGFYWSNTITPWSGSRAFRVDFSLGRSEEDGVTLSSHVLCVKNP